MTASRNTDYYELLGIHAKATPKEISSAFRRKALQYHPDRNKAPDAGARMKEINEAYRVLSDPEQRQRYDAERIKQLLAEWAVMQQTDRRESLRTRTGRTSPSGASAGREVYRPAPPPRREVAPKKPSGKSKRKRMKKYPKM